MNRMWGQATAKMRRAEDMMCTLIGGTCLFVNRHRTSGGSCSHIGTCEQARLYSAGQRNAAAHEMVVVWVAACGGCCWVQTGSQAHRHALEPDVTALVVGADPIRTKHGALSSCTISKAKQPALTPAAPCHCDPLMCACAHCLPPCEPPRRCAIRPGGQPGRRTR